MVAQLQFEVIKVKVCLVPGLVSNFVIALKYCGRYFCGLTQADERALFVVCWCERACLYWYMVYVVHKSVVLRRVCIVVRLVG